MANEKIPADSPTPAIISFYYLVDDVFNDSSLRSMYQARNKKDAANISMIDQYAITEDERDIHAGLLEDAVNVVFTKLLKYTKSIPDAIQHNSQYTPLATVAELNAFTTYVSNFAYKMTDAGTLNPGALAVIIDDIVYWDGAAWIKDNDYSQLASFVQIVNYEAYNQNYINVVDGSIKKALRFYVLRDWFGTQGLDEDAGKFAGLYIEAINIFVNNAMQLKKPLLGT